MQQSLVKFSQASMVFEGFSPLQLPTDLLHFGVGTLQNLLLETLDTHTHAHTSFEFAFELAYSLMDPDI